MRAFQLREYGPAVSSTEHREMRNAIDAASVSGETTLVFNTAGAVIAVIGPATDSHYRALNPDTYRRVSLND